MKPLFSIILSSFNSSEKLGRSIASVLSQTLHDFELIVVDDGSTDDTRKIIQEYSVLDRRIRVLVNHKNIGLTRSLNAALKLASGEVIARIDAGDSWLQNKLGCQMSLWLRIKDLCVLGTQADMVDENGGLLRKTSLPIEDCDIRKYLLRGLNPFIHSSVMFKKGLGYTQHYPCAQDVDLWRRMYKSGRFLNTTEALLKCELNRKSISYQKRACQVYYGYDSYQRFVSANYAIHGPRFLCGVSLSVLWSKVFGRLYASAISVRGNFGRLLVILVYLSYPRIFAVKILYMLLVRKVLSDSKIDCEMR